LISQCAMSLAETFADSSACTGQSNKEVRRAKGLDGG
jgi:hypothetical protein